MHITRRAFNTAIAALLLTAATATAAGAADKPIVVGYQSDALPSSLAIANGEFEKATGKKIDFRKFNSGADVIAAIAGGDVQVGYVGSSPLAAAASRGLDVKAFYLASISGTDEALVVRNGSGINSVADLKGKKLAAAPVSTDHYQLLALIKSQGWTEKDVKVFAIPQPEIVAAYNRGDIDGGFVWDPALTELKKNGKVLVTSKEVADKGAPTFSAWIATGSFAKEQPEFLKTFSAVIDKASLSFQNDKAAWNKDSENARLLAKLLGGTPIEFYWPLPPLAYLPLMIIWLGIGEASKITLLTLAMFAPVVLSAQAGVRSLPLERVNAALSLGATRWQLLVEIVLPSALPEILTGIRIALGVGWSTLVAAELIAANRGIGYMIMSASHFLATDAVFVGIALIATCAFAFSYGMRLLERALVPWKGKN